MKNFTIDEANSLQKLVKKNLVDTETLKKKGLDSIHCHTYLYSSIDRITPSELAKFKGTSISSIYKNINNNADIRLSQKALKFAKKKISMLPKIAFPMMQDYYKFLNWRAENRKLYITVSQAVTMLDFSKNKIIRNIKNGELQVIIDNGKYKISRVSIELYLINKIINYKFQIDRKKEETDKQKDKIKRKEDKIDRKKEETDRKISTLQNSIKHFKN